MLQGEALITALTVVPRGCGRGSLAGIVRPDEGLATFVTGGVVASATVEALAVAGSSGARTEPIDRGLGRLRAPVLTSSLDGAAEDRVAV